MSSTVDIIKEMDENLLASLMYSDLYPEMNIDMDMNTDMNTEMNIDMDIFMETLNILSKQTGNLINKMKDTVDNINQTESVESTELTKSTKLTNQTESTKSVETLLTKDQHDDFINYLYDKMEEEILPMHISKFSLTFNVKINGTMVNCLIDTGATMNIIGMDLIKSCGLEYCIDNRVKINLVGAGSTPTSGYIPYMEIEIEDKKYPICAFVANMASKDKMILGSAFLAFYQIALDFKKRKILINETETNFQINEH